MMGRYNDLPTLAQNDQSSNKTFLSQNRYRFIAPTLGTSTQLDHNFTLLEDSPRYDPYWIDQFKNEYLFDNLDDNQRLVQYIVDLIENQKKQIDYYQGATVSNIPVNDNLFNKESISILQDYKDFHNPSSEEKQEEFGIDNEASIEQRSLIPQLNAVDSPEDSNPIKTNLFERTKNKLEKLWSILVEYTDFIFVGSMTLTCFIVIIINRLKNSKFINFSELSLIIITVSTCFTSGNHLVNTVPNFIDRMPIFETAIFALGPFAVIWLSVKSLIDLLFPSKNQI